MKKILPILFIIFTPCQLWAEISATSATGTPNVSGPAPLMIHVEETTAVVASDGSGVEPMLDYDVTWNFGDPDSGTWQTGNSKNTAGGPIAAHVYDTAGSYTITVTVRDHTGIISTDTETITVYDPDDYFDGDDGDGIGGTTNNTFCYSTGTDFTGCPSGATEVTVASGSLSTINGGSGFTDGDRHLLRRGDSWTNTGVIASTDGPGPTNIGAFGTGTSPDDRGIYSNDPALTLSNGFLNLNDKQNWRIEHLVIDGAFSPGEPDHLVDDYRQILMYHIKAGGVGSQFWWSFWNDSTKMINDLMAIVECEADGEETATGMLSDIGSERLVFMGNFFHDMNPNTGLTGSHTVRIHQAYKAVISDNIMGGAGGNGGGRHALKLHGTSGEGGDSPMLCDPYNPLWGDGYTANANPCRTHGSQFFVVRNNIFGAGGPWEVCVEPQDGTENEALEDFVFEKNIILNDYLSVISTDLTSKALTIHGQYGVVRNNIIHTVTSANEYSGIEVFNRDDMSVAPAPTRIRIYNNTIYNPDTGSGGFYGVDISDTVATYCVVDNNLVSFPNASGTHQATRDNGTNTTIGSNNAFVDSPNFVDPNNATPTSRDFSVASPSASVIDQGATINTVLRDYLGYLRSGNGEGYDIGAFENGASDEGGVIQYGHHSSGGSASHH